MDKAQAAAARATPAGRTVANVEVLRTFLILVAVVAVLLVLSWPIVWSFDLWVLKDRSSLLNVDYLLQEHHTLGVDAFYSYGLLPILVQHVLFAIFGRGAGPMLGLSIVYLVALAAFCARLRGHLPAGPSWTLAFVALAPILFWVNPTTPYCFVVLSMLYALLCVIEGRLDLALAVAAIGCVSVPSIPIVLAALLVVLIVVEWWTTERRYEAWLARQLLPGVVAYAALVGLLTVVFGWPSVVSTLTPINQLAHYHAEHWGGVFTFLQPGTGKLAYYIGNRPFWWIVSTIILFATGIASARRMIVSRRLYPADSFVVLCLAVHAFFFTFAYGPPHQHIIYDPLLVVGVLVGLAQIPGGRLRRSTMAGFIALAVVGSAAQVRATVRAWRTTGVGPASAGFYADRGWERQWASALVHYRESRVLMLSYATGVHHYFPQIQSPDVWTLDIEQVTDADLARVLAQMNRATVVIEDLTSPDALIDANPAIQHRLDALCLVSITPQMQIWARRGARATPTHCLPNPRRFAAD